jgi:predicted glycoside hydrolase/deacetylase ChbG (UPF0249 family)
MTELAERLGYGPDARLVIINADGLGLSQAANAGGFDSLRDGLATSASLMVPAPWAREAAYQYRGEDIGVHLTLTCEYGRYRWGPITHAPSLLDGDGGLPRTIADLWEHADLDEVRRELRAQVERAILWGFDVTHLDTHMGALQFRAEFFDVYLDLAVAFDLPLRLSGASTQRSIGFPFRDLAAEEGVLFPDHLVLVPGVGSRATFDKVVSDLRPGVTEVFVHPAADTPELRDLTTDWEGRVDDLVLMTADDALRDALEASGAVRIGYKPLRDLQRAG